MAETESGDETQEDFSRDREDEIEETSGASVYNEWLPPAVKEKLPEEGERFHKLVLRLVDVWGSGSSSSAPSKTTGFVRLFESYLKARSEIDVDDVQLVVEVGIQVMLRDKINFHAQARWSGLLRKIFKRYRDQLKLTLDWRLLYNILRETHFKRPQEFYEGRATDTDHSTALVSFIRKYRYFFSPTSAEEIWNEFRPCFDNPFHNSSIEGAEFLSLFLPTTVQQNLSTSYVFSSEWINDVLQLWESIPGCYFWSSQWLSLITRCITRRPPDWFPHLRTLFNDFLNSFRVPVGGAQPSPPVDWLFLGVSSRLQLSKLSSISQAIVYLLAPGGDAQLFFSRLVDFLEPYYHPSNEGSWTKPLGRFLTSLVDDFSSRLLKQKLPLGPLERRAFVRQLLRLAHTGQFSKENSLAQACSNAFFKLSYIDPSVVLPVSISSFETAMNSVTATHQLSLSLETLALSARPILLWYEEQVKRGLEPEKSYAVHSRDTLVSAMVATLAGLDANDHSKTLAAMQLYTSVLSSLSVSEIARGASSSIFPLDWELWSSEFFDQLFFLLQGLEPGTESPDTESSNDFLLTTGSFYDALLMLLFSKLPLETLKLLLDRVKRFVTENVFPGAVDEVGSICGAATACEPSACMALLLEPLTKAFISTMSEAPRTGFCSEEATPSSNMNQTMSPALEITAMYQLQLLAQIVVSAGATLVSYQQLIKQVLSAAFDAPSQQVNYAGALLLAQLTMNLASYWPIDQLGSTPGEGVENWISSKENIIDRSPMWHLPSGDEIKFLEELIELHLRSPLSILQKLSREGGSSFSSPDREKNFICVLLSRLRAVLLGLGTCIPDFRAPEQSLTIVGSFGVALGFKQLRNEVAIVLHECGGYLLQNKGDESSIFSLLLAVIDVVVNFGTVEKNFYNINESSWLAQKPMLTEPAVNLITGSELSPKPKRPSWMIHDRVLLQNVKRSAITQFLEYHVTPTGDFPSGLELLSNHLLNMSLHQYYDIRSSASLAIKPLLTRYPLLLPKFLPVITRVLADPKASDESVLGACELLKARSFLRFILEDSSCLSSFITSILSSSHHDSPTTQQEIDLVFTWFHLCYGGVSMDSDPESFVSQITSLSARASSIHWRYNLISQALLLFLASSPFSSSPEQRLSALTTALERYLMNLTSDLAALRLFSVKALLVLLNAESSIRRDDPTLGMEIRGALLSESFGEKLVQTQALDRHYNKDDGSRDPSSMQDYPLVTLFPLTFMSDWLPTRTFEPPKTTGVAFLGAFARLVEQLVLSFGERFLGIIRRPLVSLEERAKHCVAAEIVAGVLSSGAACVPGAWDEWIGGLLEQVLKSSSHESATEWSACIRFAMAAQNKNKALQHQLLKLLAGLLPATSSSTQAAKRLNFLTAAIGELEPGKLSGDEILLLKELLREMLHNSTHAAAQVRTASGALLCLLTANLRLCSIDSKEIDEFLDSIKRRASSEAGKAVATGDETLAANKDSVRAMETITRFVITCIESGRFVVLADVVAELVRPLLLVQETRDKEFKSLVNYALYCLDSQVFPTSSISKVVEQILGAASEENWRVRIAALKFVQPFIYRHSFILEPGDWLSVWNVVVQLLSDTLLEVREMACSTAAVMVRGVENSRRVEEFRSESLTRALSVHSLRKSKLFSNIVEVHSVVLALAACVLSVPYDVPSWLPEMITVVADFSDFPGPVRATVAKTVGEFRRTHSDAWEIHKRHFSEQQLELLLNSGSASYFA